MTETIKPKIISLEVKCSHCGKDNYVLLEGIDLQALVRAYNGEFPKPIKEFKVEGTHTTVKPIEEKK